MGNGQFKHPNIKSMYNKGEFKYVTKIKKGAHCIFKFFIPDWELPYRITSIKVNDKVPDYPPRKVKDDPHHCYVEMTEEETNYELMVIRLGRDWDEVIPTEG